MVALRKRAYALYPLLNANEKDVLSVIKRLDRALNNTRSLLSRDDPKAKELVQACDFAQTILG